MYIIIKLWYKLHIFFLYEYKYRMLFVCQPANQTKTCYAVEKVMNVKIPDSNSKILMSIT